MEPSIIKTLFLIILVVVAIMVAIKLAKVIWKFSMLILIVMIATIIVLDYQGVINVKDEVTSYTSKTTKTIKEKTNETIKETGKNYLDGIKNQLTNKDK